jgi:CheY-like chemotaxis protein
MGKRREGCIMARILVVDDVAAVTALLNAILSDAGHEVVETCDGKTALELARSGGFDLIITDIMMPGVDGIEIVKRMRAEGTTIPIVAISGGAAGFPAAMSLTMSEMYGADRLLFKPFLNNEIIEAVDALLKEKGAA